MYSFFISISNMCRHLEVTLLSMYASGDEMFPIPMRYVDVVRHYHTSMHNVSENKSIIYMDRSESRQSFEF